MSSKFGEKYVILLDCCESILKRKTAADAILKRKKTSLSTTTTTPKHNFANTKCKTSVVLLYAMRHCNTEGDSVTNWDFNVNQNN